MPTREHFNPAGIAPPPANMYNHVVKVGDTLYISGQVSRGPDGKATNAGDVAAQTREVWSNLKKAVEAAGGTFNDIVKTTTYVVGAQNLQRVRQARLEVMPQERPTSTTVVVAGLADPGFLVEVEAVAVIGSGPRP